LCNEGQLRRGEDGPEVRMYSVQACVRASFLPLSALVFVTKTPPQRNQVPKHHPRQSHQISCGGAETGTAQKLQIGNSTLECIVCQARTTARMRVNWQSQIYKSYELDSRTRLQCSVTEMAELPGPNGPSGQILQLLLMLQMVHVRHPQQGIRTKHMLRPATAPLHAAGQSMLLLILCDLRNPDCASASPMLAVIPAVQSHPARAPHDLKQTATSTPDMLGQLACCMAYSKTPPATRHS